MITYCIPTYKSFAECAAAIDRLHHGTVIPDKIIVCDNSAGPGTTYLYPLRDRFPNLEIWTQARNLGVSRSWNLFHQNVPEDYIIIANDDTYVHTGTVAALIQKATAYPDDYLFTGNNTSGNIFSLFLLRKRGFELIGPFDEEFSPAYFEDNDYVRRMVIAGLHIHIVDDATFDHVGSSTMKKYNGSELSAHHSAFNKNQNYYIQKWGGLPWQEQYLTPFNRG